MMITTKKEYLSRIGDANDVMETRLDAGKQHLILLAVLASLMGIQALFELSKVNFDVIFGVIAMIYFITIKYILFSEKKVYNVFGKIDSILYNISSYDSGRIFGRNQNADDSYIDEKFAWAIAPIFSVFMYLLYLVYFVKLLPDIGIVKMIWIYFHFNLIAFFAGQIVTAGGEYSTKLKNVICQDIYKEEIKTQKEQWTNVSQRLNLENDLNGLIGLKTKTGKYKA